MVDFLYIEGYFFLALVIIFYKLVEKFIGGADLLIFGLLLTRYGLYAVSIILFYSSLIGVVFSLIKQKKELRFIPFILIGFIIFLKGGK